MHVKLPAKAIRHHQRDNNHNKQEHGQNDKNDHFLCVSFLSLLYNRALFSQIQIEIKNE